MKKSKFKKAPAAAARPGLLPFAFCLSSWRVLSGRFNGFF
jgi:hypothetical protein